MAAIAQGQLLDRYGGAVRRYFLGALHDADAADELFQEFALRFVRGDFRRADPERGRFRDFLYHMIVDHQKRRRRRPAALSADVRDPASPSQETSASDRVFVENLRRA
jgi:DNA-directed RNA polymerase specialized sigma24 family protein